MSDIVSTDKPTDDPTDREPPTDAPVPDPDDNGDDTHGDAHGDDNGKPGREAAKYRTRLRAAEAERDALTNQVVALRRAEVERVAKGAGLNPRAFWAGGADLAELVTEDGTVDVEKVKVAAQVASAALGLVRPWPDAGQGNRGTSIGRQKSTWSDAFDAARR